MDNKKWYKRISTCFWFLLATMPCWLPLINFIFIHFIHYDGVTTYSDINGFYNTNTYAHIASSMSATIFQQYTPNFLSQMFRSLFQNMNVGTISGWFPNFLAWFCWIYIVEVMVDVFVWLPRFFHNILDKGVGKID